MASGLGRRHAQKALGYGANNLLGHLGIALSFPQHGFFSSVLHVAQ